MYIKRALSVLVSVALIATLSVGCSKSAQKPATGTAPAAASGAPEAKPAGQKVVLRLAEIHPPEYPTALGDKEFARLVEEKTNGRIKIECYFSGQLGQEKAVIEQVQFGAIDFARISTAPVTEFAKELNVLQLPFIFRSTDHMWKVLQGPIGDDLLKSVEKAKMIGLNWYDAGARNMYTKKEVKSLADLKGMKIRVQQSKLAMDMITALGASPTPMDAGEVYSALQTGVIDAAENNWPSYLSFSHYEVAKNYFVDGHTRVPEITVGSKQTLEKLSKEDQEIIKKAAKDAIEFQKKEWAKSEKVAEDKVKAAGCKVVVPDEKTVAEFQKAVLPLYDTQKEYAALIKKIGDIK